MISFIPHKNKKHNLRTTIFILIVLCFSVASAYLAQNYSQIFKTDVLIQRSDSIGPTEQISITFSLPVIPSVVERDIAISPKNDVQFSWENKNRKLKISPKEYWDPESKYEITISGGRNIFLSRFDTKLNFSTKPYPAIVSTFPTVGEKDVEITIEDPITFNFSRSLDDYDMKVEIEPQKQLEFQLSDDKKTARFISNDDFQKNVQYTISVFLKLKQQSENNYHEIGRISFATAPPPPPIERNKNPKTRLEEAMLYTKAPIAVGKCIDISLKYQNMVIFEDGKALSAHIVSSGKRGMETPMGEFSIHNKAPRVWSRKYALFMPYWMAFLPSGEMGIHELPEWPGGYKEGANHLGTPVSHGCVRLGVGDAKEVYDWAEIGTPVVIHE